MPTHFGHCAISDLTKDALSYNWEITGPMKSSKRNVGAFVTVDLSQCLAIYHGDNYHTHGCELYMKGRDGSLEQKGRDFTSFMVFIQRTEVGFNIINYFLDMNSQDVLQYIQCKTTPFWHLTLKLL